MFYTNFLNCYFLKTTKQKLFERLSTIVFGDLYVNDILYDKYMKNVNDKKNPYEDKSILLQWDTYLILVNFVNTNSNHFQRDLSENDDFYFRKNHIPQLFDEKYLKLFTKKFLMLHSINFNSFLMYWTRKNLLIAFMKVF